MNFETPKIDDSFRVLHAKAHEYISDQLEQLTIDYGFGQFLNYHVDWMESSITFYNQDNSNLKLTFQTVGTLEIEGSKWIWKWNDLKIHPQEREELEIIKNYGEFYNFEYLTKPEMEVTTPIAWALTAISGYLKVSKGIFRIQQETNIYFVYFKDVLT